MHCKLFRYKGSCIVDFVVPDMYIESTYHVCVMRFFLFDDFTGLIKTSLIVVVNRTITGINEMNVKRANQMSNNKYGNLLTLQNCIHFVTSC